MAESAQSGPLPSEDERFRLLLDSVSDYAILMLDPAGHIITWTPGAAQMKGYPAKEVMGRHFSIFYPPEAVAAGWPDCELREAQRKGRFEDEGWRVRRDGSRFWANVVITALRDSGGDLVGYAKITRDLTERRQHEEALRQSEERFRLLVEGVKDYAIFMLDPSGHIASWNAGAQAMKGYAADEIIGKHFSIFYPAEAMARNWPENELQIAREHGRYEEEGWRVRKDGTQFWANVVITAVFNHAGELRGFAKLTRDLTSRKRYEEMQRSQRQMNGFLAMLAHELRNPLDPMRHALDLMRLQPEDAGTRDWARDVIDRQVGQLSRLVEDLLDVSRITMGKITLKLEDVNLPHLVAGVVESVRPLASVRQQRLEFDLGERPVHCHADPARVAQITLNLLTNAVKYTPVGGRIRVAVMPAGAFGQIRVADSGIGMAPELTEHVFEPFVQGERGLDRAEGGLGLGLTLVRRLAELHGGSVSAQSAGEGKGSTFTVLLPLASTKPVQALTKAEPKRSVRATSRRVLVVDDNRDAAATLSALVAALGHQVWTVHDGQAAVAAATEHTPDMVLLDIGLPGMSGYEVARALRGIPALRQSLVVACTGYGQEQDRDQARAAGFDHHLVKPVELRALEDLLRQSPLRGRRRSRKRPITASHTTLPQARAKRH